MGQPDRGSWAGGLPFFGHQWFGGLQVSPREVGATLTLPRSHKQHSLTRTVPREYGFSGGGPVLRNDFMSRPTHSAHLPSRAPSRGRLENASMSKNTSVPLYPHVRAELVSPRIKALAAGWQVWNSEQEGNGEAFQI